MHSRLRCGIDTYPLDEFLCKVVLRALGGALHVPRDGTWEIALVPVPFADHPRSEHTREGVVQSVRVVEERVAGRIPIPWRLGHQVREERYWMYAGTVHGQREGVPLLDPSPLFDRLIVLVYLQAQVVPDGNLSLIHI